MFIKMSGRAVKKIAAFSLLVLFNVGFAFSEKQKDSFNAKEILSDSVYSELIEKGVSVHYFGNEDRTPFVLPESPLAQKIGNDVFGNITEKMGYAVEKLFLVKKSELIENSLSEEKRENVSINDIALVMQSISKMKGMQYFSSKKKWETLYKKAFRIEDVKSKVAIDDTTEKNLDGLNILALLDDNSFGVVKYAISYAQGQNEVSMVLTNKTGIGVGIVEAVKPNDMQMVFSVVDCGDECLVYIGTYAEYEKVAMLEKRINRSFNARIDAIHKWFISQF